MNTKLTFPVNKLATTVGANGFNEEVVVSQPRIQIPVIEEVEYEFDQQKFEGYLSSSSRSNSPRKSKMVSTVRETRSASDAEARKSNPTAVKTIGNGGSLALEAAGSAEPLPFQGVNSVGGVSTLSKRARQRRRQRLAKQFAQAIESMDGVRNEVDLRSRLTQRLKSEIVADSYKPATNEWVQVKRDRSTLQERIRKRRTLLAQARALVQQARELKKEAAKKLSTNR